MKHDPNTIEPITATVASSSSSRLVVGEWLQVWRISAPAELGASLGLLLVQAIGWRWSTRMALTAELGLWRRVTATSMASAMVRPVNPCAD